MKSVFPTLQADGFFGWTRHIFLNGREAIHNFFYKARGRKIFFDFKSGNNICH